MKKVILFLALISTAHAESIDEMYSRIHRESDETYNQMRQDRQHDEQMEIMRRQERLQRLELQSRGVETNPIFNQPFGIYGK